MNKIIYIFRFFVFSSLFFAPLTVFAVSFEHDLYMGMPHEKDVEVFQQFLKDQGLYSGPVTGYFRSMTKEAAIRFQQKEGIIPALGFIGNKTRMYIEAMQTTALITSESVETLRTRIASLTAQLRALQEKLVQEKNTTVSVAQTAIVPQFTVRPYVKSQGYFTDSPFSVQNPYRVVLDWQTDSSTTDSAQCSPSVTKMRFSGKSTEYFPAPGGNYSCQIAIKNNAGAENTDTVSFATPAWVYVAGTSTQPFPEGGDVYQKIGEFHVYNGTMSDILFANMDWLISDGMDSLQNRNHEVTFLLRDGVTPLDALVGTKKFTFIKDPPPIGKPYVASVMTVPFGINLKAGEEKVMSLWVEQFKYVQSGTLNIQSTNINTTQGIGVYGGFNFTLTRASSL